MILDEPVTLPDAIEVVSAACENLVERHEYDQLLDACTDCGRDYPCRDRLFAERVIDDLKRLAKLAPDDGPRDRFRVSGTDRRTTG